jgi:hypothetical protein
MTFAPEERNVHVRLYCAPTERFLKDRQSYKHAAPPEQSGCVKYVDAVKTVSDSHLPLTPG